MDFLAHYGLFLLKTMTLIVGFLLAVAGLLALTRKAKPDMEISSLNKEYEEMAKRVRHSVLGKEAQKEDKKKKQSKASIKEQKSKPNLFVCNFSGDLRASQAESLRELITAILSIATERDEVVVKIESPGGSVNGYGLAASELRRIRDKNIPLTVCIDKVAASGGYLMACIANKILAAPFAIVGSIGVVSQLPNFHRWLKKHDIDVELLTAGEYKRTLTILGENTEKGRQKFQEDLDKIHRAFRDFVLANRQQVDIAEVATGEHWLAVDAFDLRLVDQLKTSDEYIIEKLKDFNVYQFSIPQKQSVVQKLLKPAVSFVEDRLGLSVRN